MMLNPAALCRQATALHEQGLLAQAVDLLEQALALDPFSYDARISLAQVRRDQARDQEAAILLTQVTHDFPDRATPWWMLANILLKAGKASDALIPMERYAALLPHDAQAQARCAELAIDLGDWNKAKTLVARARSVDSENPAARFLEGRVLFEDGATENAIEAYHDAVRMEPRFGEALGGRVVEAWMMDFPSWAATGSGTYRMLAAAHELELPAPEVIPREESRYWPARKERVPAIFVGTIEHAEVFPPESTVLASDGCFFVEGFVTSPEVYPRKVSMVKYASQDGRVLLDLPRTPRDLDVPCILLARSNNYFHFLFESLPRIWSVEQFGVNGDVPALVSDDLYRTELELLALLGFPEERLIRVPDGASIRCRTLYAPSLFGQGYTISPLAVRFLRERVLARVKDVPDLPRRFYLSRNRMLKRHVRNESEILPRLKRHGFRTIYPEELGVAEQVRLFAGAEAILSPDSSALANLAFAAPGTKVAVFNWRGLHKPLWHCIAFHSGAHLTYIHADPIAETDSMLAHRDLRVDLALLDAWLDTF